MGPRDVLAKTETEVYGGVEMSETKTYESAVRPIAVRFVEKVDGHGEPVWLMQTRAFRLFGWRFGPWESQIEPNWRSSGPRFLNNWEFATFEEAQKAAENHVKKTRDLQRETICAEEWDM